jgi:hypothetical protein
MRLVAYEDLVKIGTLEVAWIRPVLYVIVGSMLLGAAANNLANIVKDQKRNRSLDG